MSLRRKQSAFTKAMAELTLWAFRRGYELTDGHCLRCKDCPVGHPRSLHKSKLAKDLNLFVDGQYKRSTKAHLEIGERWEKMGGIWGGRFSKPDGNHYEYGPGLLKRYENA